MTGVQCGLLFVAHLPHPCRVHAAAAANMANVNSPARESPSRELKDKEKDDSDLDPAAFLKSVRELSEKRDREDAQRLRNLEEEIQKGREERAARRAGESTSHIIKPSAEIGMDVGCSIE